MGDNDSDRELVRRCLDGEPRAFARLLDLYKSRVFSLLLRFVQNQSDAEDLAQETFIKAFRHLRAYDAEHPLVTWLFKIAHNTALDFLRARRPHVSLDDSEQALEIAEDGPSLESRHARLADARLLEKLLAALPALYREALLLRHHEGLDYAQIARVLDLPEGTVKIRLFRAREMLRRKIEGVQQEKK